MAVGVESLPLDDTQWRVLYCAEPDEAEEKLRLEPNVKAVIATLEKGVPRTGLPVFLLGAEPEDALELGAEGILRSPPERADLLLHLERCVAHPSLGALLDGLEDAFCLLGRDRRYLYVNKVAAAMSCLEPGAMVGKDILELFPTLEGTDFMEHLERGLTEGRPARFRRQTPR